MVKGLYTAYTGMVQEQRRLDTLTNNLANATNNAYKKEGMTSKSFGDELAWRIKDTQRNIRGIGYLDLGVKVGETYTDWSQGPFQVTDKESDVAIAGDGFFSVEFTDKQGNTSVRLTRDGEFTVDVNGYLRTVDGDYVLNQQASQNRTTGQAGYIRIDPVLPYTINPQGNIYQEGQLVGAIGLVDVDNYDYIYKTGENMYDIEDGGQIIASTASLEQGALEQANIQVVDEMVSMITVQRAYEAGQRMIRTEDETLEMTVSQVGSV